MFSVISLNATAGSEFTYHAGKVAITSAIITLVAGLFIYNLMGGPGSFLPTTMSAGYVLTGVAVLFMIDAIRYSCKHYTTQKAHSAVNRSNPRQSQVVGKFLDSIQQKALDAEIFIRISTIGRSPKLIKYSHCISTLPSCLFGTNLDLYQSRFVVDVSEIQSIEIIPRIRGGLKDEDRSKLAELGITFDADGFINIPRDEFNCKINVCGNNFHIEVFLNSGPKIVSINAKTSLYDMYCHVNFSKISTAIPSEATSVASASSIRSGSESAVSSSPFMVVLPPTPVASVSASEEDSGIFHFPAKVKISAFLSSHRLTKDPYLTEKGIIEKVAESFSGRELSEVGINTQLLLLFSELNTGLPIPTTTMLQKNLAIALKDCARTTAMFLAYQL